MRTRRGKSAKAARPPDLVLEPAMIPVSDFRATVKEIHNYIYANDTIKQQARVFEELLKILFIKLYDESVASSEKRFRIEPDEAESFRNGVASLFVNRIASLFRDAVRGPGFDAIFSTREKIELSPHVLAFTIRRLQDVNLSGLDAKGTAFQAIVGPQLRAEKGQFFTPEPAKRMLVGILDPRPGEVVLDPACGSGGLLISAMEHMRLSYSTRNADFIYGADCERGLARIAKIYMLLSGDGHSNICAVDSLGNWDAIRLASNGKLSPEMADVILTNPPFGTRGKVDREDVLRNFPNLAGDRPRQVPEILFIERVIQFLKPGGRAGIVLPIGTLANSSLRYVRDYIRRECQILAVVSMPVETFRPAENGVRSALLFIRKWPKAQQVLSEYPTFRAICHKVGYDMRDRPLFKRDARGSYIGSDGSPLAVRRNGEDRSWLIQHAALDEDISEVLSAWERYRDTYRSQYLW